MKYSLNILLCILSSHAFSQFKDIVLDSDINHCHISADLLGGGIAVIDINNDGLEDLYFTGGSGADLMLLNLGDFKFQDVTFESKLYFITRGLKTTAVSVGDLNGDSYSDLVIATRLGEPTVIALNNGDGTFSDATHQSGLDDYTHWGMSVAIFDINKDSYPDIYVGNYIEEFHTLVDDNNEVYGFDHMCSPNQLFINQGDMTFSEEAESYAVNSKGCTLASMVIDINNDNYNDIVVVNDFGEFITPNQVYLFDTELNQFIESSHLLNLQDSIYGMGLAYTYLNDDDYPDFYFTNIGPNVFRLSNANNTFNDQADQLGIVNDVVETYNTTGWGALFLDSNNDGSNDLFVTNGPIGTADYLNTIDYGDPNKLYLGNQQNHFIDASDSLLINNLARSRGVTVADLNLDGSLEVITHNIERIRYEERSNLNIYSTSTENANSWVNLQLVANPMQPFMVPQIGTKVMIYSAHGVLKQQIISGGSHASSSSSRLHFGLGDLGVIDSILVSWPDGSKDRYIKPSINHHLRLYKGGSQEILTCQMNWGCSSTTEAEVTHTPKSENLLLFPNPVFNTLQVKGLSNHPVQVWILDVSGRRIKSAELLSTKKHPILTIEVSDLEPGVYFLRIGNDSSSYSFIKN